MNPLVSVIIPTFNEERYIGECLESLEKQTHKNFEIIIVDDGSTDKTIEVVKSSQKAILIQGKHRGPGYSRNIGAKAAKGEFLVFVDADMTFDKDYLKNLISPLLKDKKNEIIGTTHDLEIVNNLDNKWSRCWGKIRVNFRDKKDWKKVIRGGAPFRAIRKKKFLELGGFDPLYGYADDQTFWFKYNLLPLLAEKTTCYHRNPENLREVYKQSRWIGASLKKDFFNSHLLTSIILLFSFLLFPFVVLYLSIKKCIALKEWKLFFPWMIIFTTIRYFGILSGIIRRIFFKKNHR